MKLVLALVSSFVALGAHAASNASLETSVDTSTRTPRFELRTAPLAFLAAWTTVDAGYRFNEHFSTGPAVVSYKMKSGNMFVPSYDGEAIGWYANYYFRPATASGVYSSLHVYKEDYVGRGHPSGEDEGSHRVGTRANLTFGQRLSRSFFDILFGGGIELRNHSVDETKRAYAPASSTYSLVTTHKDETRILPFVEIKAGVQF